MITQAVYVVMQRTGVKLGDHEAGIVIAVKLTRSAAEAEAKKHPNAVVQKYVADKML
jgi:hypothetical protein